MLSKDLTATDRDAALGHLALKYGPGDEKQARRLLELLGCTLIDNGAAPGKDGFCTVLVNSTDANYADNIIFLSQMTPEHEAVENAVRAALRPGELDEDPAVTKYRNRIAEKPESVSHIGIRYRTLQELEQVLAAIETATAPGGELEGRASLVKYRPRPGGHSDRDDAAVAELVAASPAFSGEEPDSFAPHWIQCFVSTDLCGFGILAFGSLFEIDYVFDPFFAEPPTFGKLRSAG